MKNLARFLFALVLACALRGADVTIHNLATTAQLPASNDYSAFDGATQGSRKFLATGFALATATRTSLANLSITNAADGIGVVVLGGSAIGDGGGGTYYWSASSTATPNGTTIIQPASLPGTGRWIRAIGGVTPPSPSNLGGVFSNIGAAHSFVSAINTDGSVTLTQPSASDVSGLGSIASQNANAVAITGGTLNNVQIGSSVPNYGIFTTVSATSNGTAINATNATSATTSIDIGNSLTQARFMSHAGAFSSIGTLNNTPFNIMVNGSQIASFTASGINGTQIGAVTPSAGFFTTLQSNNGNVNAVLGNLTPNAAFVTSVNNVAVTAPASLATLTLGSGKTVTMGNTVTLSGTDGAAVNVGAGGNVAYTGNTLNVFAATTSAQLLSVISDETGTGLVMGNNGATINNASIFGATIENSGIGLTSPMAAKFTTVAFASLANLRTTKANMNVIINVRDYGALGDGSTNDTSAIAAAATAAVSARGVLYFPASAGQYITDRIAITSASGLVIAGDGWGSSRIKARTPSQVLNVASSDHVTVCGLSFDGSCTARTAGQQAVVLDASALDVHDIEIVNSGEFALYIGPGSLISDIAVEHVYLHSDFADGINLGNVTKFSIANCLIDGVDDDCIAVGAATKGTVIGNYCRARTDLGTTWGRGILCEGACADVQVVGNIVDTIKQTGIYLNISGGNRPTRVTVADNYVINASVNSGHAIAVYGTTDCVLRGNHVYNPATGNCLDIADWQNLTIEGGEYTQRLNQFCRGIHADEGGGWASSWDILRIKGVSINMIGSGTANCIYLSPATSTMNTVVIDGVNGYQNTAGDYIALSTARTGTLGKIVNNVAAKTGQTINPSSSVGVITLANNN